LTASPFTEVDGPLIEKRALRALPPGCDACRSTHRKAGCEPLARRSGWGIRRTVGACRSRSVRFVQVVGACRSRSVHPVRGSTSAEAGIGGSRGTTLQATEVVRGIGTGRARPAEAGLRSSDRYRRGRGEPPSDIPGRSGLTSSPK
jgi:hypothetical protein